MEVAAMIKIKVAEDFSKYPGTRNKIDGDFSGEEFREKCLEPHFVDPSDNSKIVIDFDGGAEAYAPSFIEEAFGGLARIHGIPRCLERIEIISNEDALIEREIMDCIKESHE